MVRIARGKRAPVGMPGDTLRSPVLTAKRCVDATCFDVPDTHGSVPARLSSLFAAGSNGDGADDIAMHMVSRQFLSSRDVPDADRAIFAGKQDTPAIGMQGEPMHRRGYVQRRDG